MKKILPCFLAVLMLFTTTIRPVYAAEVVNDTFPSDSFEPCDFSYNFAGDSIVITLEDGTILEVRPNDATTYNAAAGALLISSSGGALGAGSASILAAALPILGYVLAAGVVIYSVVGLAECVMDLYYLLSEASQAECASIVDSGAESYTPSATLKAELDAAMGEVFYTDDGTFLTSGITFDPTNMLEYNNSAQYVYGNDLTASIYKYALGSSAVAIAGTSLSIALVDSPFTEKHEDIQHAFQVTNSVTGASLTYMPTYSSSWLECDHCSYSISAPVVETLSDWTDGEVYHTLGFWVLRECSIEAAGESCSECYYRYQSSYYGESDDLFSTNLFYFTGTGIEGLDNVIYDGQWYTGPRAWELERQVAMDGVTDITLPYSAVTTIASDLTYAMALTDTAAVPEEDTPVYLPTTAALSDANTLTQEGALTGDYSTTVETPAVPDTDTSGFWATLWGWLTDILTAIIAIPGNIVDGITGTLEKLFVPDLTAVGELVDVYTNKFDWVTDIYYFVKEIFDRLTWNEPPKIPINLELAESKYDWGSGDNYALDMTWYARYKDSVDAIVSGIIWVFFLWRLFRRLPDILSGVGMTIEDSTLERGHVWKDRAEKAERRSKRK